MAEITRKSDTIIKFLISIFLLNELPFLKLHFRIFLLETEIPVENPNDNPERVPNFLQVPTQGWMRAQKVVKYLSASSKIDLMEP